MRLARNWCAGVSLKAAWSKGLFILGWLLVWGTQRLSGSQIYGNQIYVPSRTFESAARTKTVYGLKYGVLVEPLRERREQAGMTQADCLKAIAGPSRS